MVLKTKIFSALVLLVLPFWLPLSQIDNPFTAAVFLWPYVWPVPLILYELFGKNEILREVARISGAVICLLAGYFVYAVDAFLAAVGTQNFVFLTWISIAVIAAYFSASFFEMARSLSSTYQRLEI